jgi:hypothetical protein
MTDQENYIAEYLDTSGVWRAVREGTDEASLAESRGTAEEAAEGAAQLPVLVTRVRRSSDNAIVTKYFVSLGRGDRVAVTKRTIVR